MRLDSVEKVSLVSAGTSCSQLLGGGAEKKFGVAFEIYSSGSWLIMDRLNSTPCPLLVLGRRHMGRCDDATKEMCRDQRVEVTHTQSLQPCNWPDCAKTYPGYPRIQWTMGVRRCILALRKGVVAQLRQDLRHKTPKKGQSRKEGQLLLDLTLTTDSLGFEIYSSGSWLIMDSTARRRQYSV